jgi:transposase-like protein
MTRPHRRYSAEFKLRLVEAYIARERSAKSLATEHGIAHSLILVWADKYRRGELTPEIQRAEEVREYEAAVADLQRKLVQMQTRLAALKEREPKSRTKRARSHKR